MKSKALSNAEWARKYREARKQKDPEWQKKKNGRKRKIQLDKISKISESEKEKLKEHNILMRTKKRDNKKKEIELSSISLKVSPKMFSSKNAFQTPQSQGKAITKCKKALPKYPRKVKQVIKVLAKTSGLSIIDPDEEQNHHETQLGERTIEAVEQFYIRTNNVWTSPGMKDIMTY